ncbi:MAG: hypothetical protein U0694_02645 [Anaerolineae bacterium]
MKDLPEFRAHRREDVLNFVQNVLTNDAQLKHHDVLELIEHKDGHYRVIFNPAYFILPEGQTEPSKSQWATLKKKFKRRDPNVFVFKEHGETKTAGTRSYYLDFGFFAHPRRD